MALTFVADDTGSGNYILELVVSELEKGKEERIAAGEVVKKEEA